MKKKADESATGSELSPETRLVVGGRDPFAYHGFVNPPVYHASTVLYPSADDLIAHRARYQYGRRGTPTSEALEGALQALEGPRCAGVALVPSGLSAVSTALLAALMGAMSSVFNSASTMVTLDFYKKLRPAASEKQLVTFGRIATGGMVLLGLL